MTDGDQTAAGRQELMDQSVPRERPHWRGDRRTQQRQRQLRSRRPRLHRRRRHQRQPHQWTPDRQSPGAARGPRGPTEKPVRHPRLPERACRWRHSHGHRSGDQRGVAAPAAPGCAEPVRRRRIGVSAQRRLQPDVPARRAPASPRRRRGKLHRAAANAVA
jgi:hypothetical protein